MDPEYESSLHSGAAVSATGSVKSFPVLPDADATVPDLQKELRLARLKIQKLEIAAERSRLKDRMSEIDDEARSLMSDCKPQSHTEFSRARKARDYVESLPNPIASPAANVRLNPETLRVPANNEPPSLVESAQVLRACMSLPVKQLPKFDGRPLNYHSFMRQFMSSVGRYTSDPTDLLTYLIQCCEGAAAESIQRCMILEPEKGYREALNILERRFGEPHVIARTCIDELTEGSQLKSNDQQSLARLADSMRLCSVTLKQLNYESDLNATKTLRAIVRRLPSSLQSRWCDYASSVLKGRREPTFDELAEFVSDRADAATTRLVYLGDENMKGTTSKCFDNESSARLRSVPRVHTMATLSQVGTHSGEKVPSFRYQPTCAICEQHHYVDQCTTFRSMAKTDRIQVVKSADLCCLCLKPNHNPSNCRSRKVCGWEGCSGQHHPLLHQNSTVNTTEATVNFGAASKKSHVALGVVPVRVQGHHGLKIVNALLDTGSDTTLVSRALIQELGLFGATTTLALSSINGRCQIEADRVSLSIGAVESPDSMKINAWAIDNLPPVSAVLIETKEQEKWMHLSQLELPLPSEKPIELLIGMDVPAAHWVVESKYGGHDDPYAIRTPLGWMILGPISSGGSARASLNSLHLIGDETLKKFEDVIQSEFTGLTSMCKGNSREDLIALSCVRENTRLVDHHYEVPLPWKAGCPSLQTNRVMAIQRLNQLAQRLNRDERLMELYRQSIDEYLTKGYAEPAPSLRNSSDDAWYLPHHPVFHPMKPNKVRVVFDCACKFQSCCLNSQLLSGPDIGNCLFGVLLRFRQHPYVFAADIEAMFHQVRVPDEQRRYLRFLWWPNGDTTSEPTDLQMTAHPFGATSSPFCAAFALRRALEDNQDMLEENDLSEAKLSFYVDDCLYSSNSIQRITTFAKRLTASLKAGGFNLTKWSSNVKELLDDIPSAEQAQAPLCMDLQMDVTKRMLGVEWDMIEDAFCFRMGSYSEKTTRRKMLSYVASIYDPLGLVCPAVLPGRLLLQNLTRRGVEWDTIIDDGEEKKWRNWVSGLASVTELTIPRCMQAPSLETPTFQLHCFSDASERAFGAAIYLLSSSPSGINHCSLVCGKSRVAPIKAVTIPRLELAAAVLAVRLAEQVKTQCTLPLESSTFWTDSMIVLQTIRNTSTRFHVFVANRLTIIHDHTMPNQWRYVDGRQNPADMASRGVTAAKLSSTSWFTGPEFLLRDPGEWPSNDAVPTEDDATCEFKRATVTLCTSEPSWFDRFSHFTSWIGLVRTVAWLRRFCSFILNKRANPTHGEPFLATKELTDATACIARCIQDTAFPEELRLLRQNPTESKRALISTVSPLRKLNPFLYDGVMRVGGRLKWSLLPFDAKHPIILPRRHFVTRLIIQYYHNRAGHVGTSQVLAMIRSKFWVIQGQAAVRSVISSCFYCRRWFSQPCYQVMAPLPVDRTKIVDRPFAITGVDYFGPLLVRRGRGTEKRYGCLFTCMSIRAIHIEVAQALDTDSFLCAFFRFAARRGNPSKLYSDNGTNFKGAEQDIKQCLRKWDQDQIHRKLSERECEWVFSAPKSSHQGGVWERQIRSVRRVLRGLLGELLVDDQTLQTALVEVEKIINDRPLLKLTSDPNDFAALTPSHLLLLNGNPCTVPGEFNRNVLRKRWRNAQHLADIFWTRWLKEYIPSLTTCQKWFRRGMDLIIGDLVLLVDENQHRGQWKKGVVEEVIVSRDNVVRQVRVRTSQGSMLRDVRQLCLLESACEKPEPSYETSERRADAGNE